jgi:hypothetical protein
MCLLRVVEVEGPEFEGNIGPSLSGLGVHSVIFAMAQHRSYHKYVLILHSSKSYKMALSCCKEEQVSLSSTVSSNPLLLAALCRRPLIL